VATIFWKIKLELNQLCQLFRKLSEVLCTQGRQVRLVTLLFLEVGKMCEVCAGLCRMIESAQLRQLRSGIAVSNKALGVEW